MSTRPRPVTATVTKPRWMQIPDSDTVSILRRFSLGSEGSTASLTSLLDHDSYTSVISDSEFDVQDVPRICSSKGEDLSRTFRRQYEYEKRASQSRKVKTLESSSSEMSPWELWLLQKTQEDRQRRQEESKKKKVEQEKKMNEKKVKEEKLSKAVTVRKEWEDKKLKAMVLAKQSEKQRTECDKKNKDVNKKSIIEKSEKKFNEWMINKKKEEKLRRREEKEIKRKEEESKRTKAEIAERKFKEWKKEAAKRPSSAANSTGYLDGKLKGFHDTGAYPSPSYCNPIPWQPIPVPNTRKDKSQSKGKKYVWNPNKYY